MLKTDDRVKFVRLGGDVLEGTFGTVLGISASLGFDTIQAPGTIFIVGLDEPIELNGNLYKAVTMTSSCLEKI